MSVASVTFGRVRAGVVDFVNDVLRPQVTGQNVRAVYQQYRADNANSRESDSEDWDVCAAQFENSDVKVAIIAWKGNICLACELSNDDYEGWIATVPIASYRAKPEEPRVNWDKLCDTFLQKVSMAIDHEDAD